MFILLQTSRAKLRVITSCVCGVFEILLTELLAFPIFVAV